MRILQTFLAGLLITTLFPPALARAARQQRQPAECDTLEDCRARGLAAAAEGDHERFHDFAWRAVQKGPRNDPELMALLARAMSLSGRPHDALVILRRLADMGVVTDAATSEDFRRVRALDGWADLQARLAPLDPAPPAPEDPKPPAAAAAAPVPPAAPTPPPLTSVSPFAATRAMRVPPPAAPLSARGSMKEGGAAPAAEPNPALRFTTLPFEPAGLAYDAVSARFIMAHRDERKLTVIGQRSQRLANLVGEDSAGFGAIEAIALDPREGNLWVASTPDAEAAPRLHKLQLISGRLLFTASSEESRGGRLADIAIMRDGSVLALDAPNRRLLRLAPGARELQTVSALELKDPVSLATAPGGSLYVASAEGIARLDAAGRSAGTLAPPEGLDPARLTWIRSHGGALIVVERSRPDRFRIVRIRLDANGRRATGLEVLDEDAPLAGPSSLAVAGDTLFYLARERGFTGSGGMDLTIRRVPLGR